jgi:phosphoribosylamine--glycine ligase/phosphoribosylformylglycinamidine cyclo-ligase
VATKLDVTELHRTLNMGVGMVVVAAAHDADSIRAAIDEPTWVIGELVPSRHSQHRVELR